MHKNSHRTDKLNPSYNHFITIEQVVELYNQKLSITAIAKKLDCSRKTIFNRLRLAGIKPINRTERLFLTIREPKEKYKSIHAWLSNNYGKADKCENKECLGLSKIYHWSLIYGKEYEYKRENFKMLCAKCHHKYDFDNGLHENQRTASKKNAKKMGLIYGKIIGERYGAINGHKNCKLTEHQIREIRKKSFVGLSRRSLAKKYAVSPTTITDIVNKQRYLWVK